MTVDDEQIDEGRRQVFAYFKEFPFFKLLGMELLDVQPCSSKVQITYRPDLCQPMGIMHGGVIASLVDTGIAHALLLTDTYRQVMEHQGGIVSVDQRIKYFRPVTHGVVTCSTTIPRLGRHIIHGESTVVNEAGKEVARGDSIYMTVRGMKQQ